MNVLEVHQLGKAYRYYGAEGRRVLSWFWPSFKPIEEHWVLRNINLSIASGEAVGIVGQNGAGKSTLLKLITGTLRQTEGLIQINGRIAAILELGMGFNPEFTGRQNVYHAAGLMGFNATEIAHIMPEIEVFAEIGEYFDQPVRTYSSGMQMRVAFAVATAFRPEVLIVDEALSVGDAYFQHKSFERIRQFQREGTTLLIVSHDKEVIQSICDHAIMLESGIVVKEGSPVDVMDFYNAIIAEEENATIKQSVTKTGQLQTISGTGEAVVTDTALLDAVGNRLEAVNVGNPVCLKVTARIDKDIPRLVLGIMVKDRLGQLMYGTNTHHTNQALNNVSAGETLSFYFYFDMTLGPGAYSVSTALVSTDTHLVNNYEWRDFALIFNVVNMTHDFFGGTTWLKPDICIERNQ